MLFNCFQCGKRISSKGKNCPYCASIIESFVVNLGQEKGSLKNLRDIIQEKHKGSIFSFMMKEKV